MPNPKAPYPAQLREEMVELVRAGKGPAELAKDFGCHVTSILNWVRMADDADGVVPSRKRIAALMRQEHMRGVSRRRSFCITTERDVQHRPVPDLVNREFVATDINQLWVADMTCIPTWTGFLHLAMVIDVYNRKVVGWAFGERMTSDLVILALNMALTTRKPESVIHHSDQGS